MQSSEILVTVNVPQIRERFRLLKQEASPAEIVPVIKNNANGLGFRECFDILASEGVTGVACSYAREFLKCADREVNCHGAPIFKLAWNWYPSQDHLSVKDLVLVCKTLQQLEFCLKNKTAFHLSFNVMMNRGGFVLTDIPSIIDLLDAYRAPHEIVFCSHDPHEDEAGIRQYFDIVSEYKEQVEARGLHIVKSHVANSVTYRHAVTHPEVKDVLGDYVRLGEELVCPKVDDRFHPGHSYEPSIVSTYVLTPPQSVRPGDNLGYCARTVTPKTTHIVVIPVGYYTFENVSAVEVEDTKGISHKCPVLVEMHDTAIVDVSNINPSLIVPGCKVILLSASLLESNWNRCIQRTCKFNPDLVNFTYNH